jgi:hypothetical protein
MRRVGLGETMTLARTERGVQIVLGLFQRPQTIGPWCVGLLQFFSEWRAEHGVRRK